VVPGIFAQTHARPDLADRPERGLGRAAADFSDRHRSRGFVQGELGLRVTGGGGLTALGRAILIWLAAAQRSANRPIESFDVADLYKSEITVPTAFRVVREGSHEVERRSRLACRDIFYEGKLQERILPDIAEVLGAGDDLGESADELTGRIISVVDRAAHRSLSG